MARATKLKVYRTPIGFHDAYVAAPSQKAALAAWGSDADLFARGIAERVDDPDLAREPLEKPGTIVKRSRGTTAEQLAALPPDKPKGPVARAGSSEPSEDGRPGSRSATRTRPTPKRPPKPKPRPSRATLDAAEKAIAEADDAHAERRAHLVEEEARLARKRRELDAGHDAEREQLERRRAAAEAKYAQALRRWRT